MIIYKTNHISCLSRRHHHESLVDASNRPSSLAQEGPYALNRGVTCGSTVNRVLGLHLFRRFNRVLTSEFEFGRSLGVKVVVEL